MDISDEERNIRLNEMRRWCRKYNATDKTHFCVRKCPFYMGTYCSVGLEAIEDVTNERYHQAIEINTKFMDEWYEKFYQLTLDKIEDM